MTTRTPSDGPQEQVVERSRLDLVREGAARDGVKLVHYRPRFVVPGSKLERRAERKVAFWLFVAFLGGLGYLVVSIWWPWRYVSDHGPNFLFTPLLGLCMALGLGGLGIAVVGYAKWLMPEDESVQERHDGRSDEDDRATTVATLAEAGDATGLGRRSLIKRTLGLSVLGLTAMAVAPLIGLFKKPGRQLFTTQWKNGIRLVRDDGTPIKPADMKPGSIQTVFPDAPGGNTRSDAPTMLIRLRPTEHVAVRKGREDYHFGDYYAYSKICTHAGCPVSLYEQQTNRLLCPCHQSQFDVLDGCRPIFGPASRSLPQLPIGVDEEGYFVAKSDYKEAVGPAFWERP
ncbi:MAG: (2Fe-2S)-binding protein [Pseudonocardiales bacterium]|nr:MAG: (2Fe-2S)-binding protein [Pseudonocardiales bacterium]